MGDSIKDYFIRPQRQTYYSFDLGPTVLFVASRRWLRSDFQVINPNNHKLSVSFYSCEQEGFQNCLVYLHTHNGSRLEGVPLLEELLSLPINVCLFDFAGYGNSQGSTVSLGWKEASDINSIIQYLKQEMGQKKFVLWGRSMGAVAGLLYLASRSENEVIGGIFDSPFHSLQKLALQLGSRSSNLPEVLLKPLIFLLKSSLKEEIDFSELELQEKVGAIKVPAVFLASQLDNFVHYSHSELLYKNYGGPKELIYIEKDHNQLRKTQDLSHVYSFVKRLNSQHPKGWQTVLANHLAYAKKLYSH